MQNATFSLQGRLLTVRQDNTERSAVHNRNQKEGFHSRPAQAMDAGHLLCTNPTAGCQKKKERKKKICQVNAI
jgi:hypothetical protein